MPLDALGAGTGASNGRLNRPRGPLAGGPSGRRLLRFSDGGVALVAIPEEATARWLHLRRAEPAVAVDLHLANPGIARRRPLSRQRLDGDGLVQRLLTPRHGQVDQAPRVEA